MKFHVRRGSLYNRVPCPGAGGSLHSEVQCIMGNGHMGPPCEQRDITENITFKQLQWYLVRMTIITTRKRTLGQGNIFVGMCQQFCSQGVSASVHVGISPQEQDHAPPWDQAPPRDQVLPREQSMLGDMVNERAVCILLKCNRVLHAKE